MACYLVELTFPDGLAIPVTDEGAQVCLTVVGNNAVAGVEYVFVEFCSGWIFRMWSPSPDGSDDGEHALLTSRQVGEDILVSALSIRRSDPGDDVRQLYDVCA